MPLKCGLMLSLLASSTFCAGVDDFRVAVHYYKTRHYSQASDILERLIIGNYAASADAHYYYANCLLKINRRDEALNEYRRVIQLAPNSLIAKYSARVVDLCQGTTTTENDSGSASKFETASNTPPDLSGDPYKKITLKEKDAIAAEIKAKLPPLPELVTGYKLGVSLDHYRATGQRNVFRAQEYWAVAKKAHEQAMENLKKVLMATSGMAPSQRLRGESEERLRLRQEVYKDKVKDIVKPYAENVIETEDWLKEKTAVLNGDAS